MRDEEIRQVVREKYGLAALRVTVSKLEALRAAYAMAKENDGAPGIDGVTFEAIEAAGVEPANLAINRADLIQYGTNGNGQIVPALVQRVRVPRRARAVPLRPRAGPSAPF